jgi:fructose-1,6-bisphosphatase/inositol monophosphatase family enzyme
VNFLFGIPQWAVSVACEDGDGLLAGVVLDPLRDETFGYDAFYERGLQPWDRAAGELLCARAGLELRELRANGALPAGLLVAPATLAPALHELVGP